MKIDKKYYIFAMLLGVALVAFFVWMKNWALSAVFAVMTLSAVVLLVILIIKEKKEAAHSEAFKEIKRIVNDGYRRAYQSFYPSLLDGIQDWEREEIEDYIWDCFHNKGFCDMARLLPKLTKYDGIAALKNSYSSADNDLKAREYAFALYEATGDEQYKI